MKKCIDDRMMTTGRDSLLVRKSALFTIFLVCNDVIRNLEYRLFKHNFYTT